MNLINLTARKIRYQDGTGGEFTDFEPAKKVPSYFNSKNINFNLHGFAIEKPYKLMNPHANTDNIYIVEPEILYMIASTQPEHLSMFVAPVYQGTNRSDVEVIEIFMTLLPSKQSERVRFNLSTEKWKNQAVYEITVEVINNSGTVDINRQLELLNGTRENIKKIFVENIKPECNDMELRG